jgi:radical SAM superfamily enzyme YgiQ (UPF0313 family)
MNILFVYNDINVKGGAKSYHFGVGILAALLKQKGHTVKLFYNYDLFKLADFLKTITDFKPQIVAFTSDFTQFPYIQEMCKAISDKNIFTIAGGPHPSLFPECLGSTEGLNAVCRGEGEGAILDLVNAIEKQEDVSNILNLWVKKDETIIKNPSRPFIQNLDSLPFGDRDIFDYQSIIDSDYDRGIFMLSRGCPFNCTYCGSPAMGKLQEGKYVRFRSVDNGIAEIKQVISKYKVKSLFFADDVFTIDKQYVEEFSKKYKKEIGLPFEVTTRVESSRLDMFQDLKAAGCWRVAIGIESGNEWFREKYLNRRMKNTQIVQAFQDARQAGLVTKSYNIVGFPFETKELFNDTVKINAQINPDTHVCYIFNPYPGTKLFDVALENNFLDKGYFKHEFIHRTDTPLRMPQFTRKEILSAYRNFSFNVYRHSSLLKALIYKIYYSRFGEKLIRLCDPVKKIIQKVVMKSK